MGKIKFLIGTFRGGGAERVISNLAYALEDKFETEIVLYGKNAVIEYDYVGKLSYLDKDSSENLLKRICSFLKRVRKIKVDKKKDDVIYISFLTMPNIINVLANKDQKTIISVRNYTSLELKGNIVLNFLVSNFYKKADKIIANSEMMKKDLVEKYNISSDKVKVIYNSYPISKIESLSKMEIENKYKAIFENPVIITAGRLNDQKGQWHLIRAFKKVKQFHKNAKLVLLGKGELMDYLTELSKDLGLVNDIHFLGFTENPFKYVSKSTVFAFSSLFEGFPNALAEAMVCNIPIVSADCLSGPREILAPLEVHELNFNYENNIKRHGILFPVPDGIKHSANVALTSEEDIMANKLIEVLGSKDVREHYAKKAKKRIQDFEIENIIKEWLNILE